MSVDTRSRPVSVAELQLAYRKMLLGDFRTSGPARPAQGWRPAGAVLPVVGACAGAGASTLALALATAAGHASFVECANPATSRLTGAATEELGRHESWIRGSRGSVILWRPAHPFHTVADVPLPPETLGDTLCVLDVAWDAGGLTSGASWLGTTLATSRRVVAVAPATVPGVRRLDALLRTLGHSAPILALVGPPRRAPEVRSGLARLLREHALDPSLVVTVPWERRLAVRGVDSHPLPRGLHRAAAAVLRTASVEGVSS
ncbi:hypothetical protein [Arthrobacter sp. NEB 688]|uniref:hypothetical protein n=1 Tax=Arthrobacter sp. NEB 688 TaxID=904039 RepID=UPI001567A8B4|nr:hypothetical protein [Arthrobacter sp. NEB 688]QKE85120.1 hypothetical protein HL663_15040 [Arthrobacter sp. NEB 688]